jgi:hypothetical protein
MSRGGLLTSRFFLLSFLKFLRSHTKDVQSSVGQRPHVLGRENARVCVTEVPTCPGGQRHLRREHRKRLADSKGILLRHCCFEELLPHFIPLPPALALCHCCVASHCATLHYTTLHHATLHYCTTPHPRLHYTPLHYTTLHYILYSTAPLHCTTLHCTTLHDTTLHHTT